MTNVTYDKTLGSLFGARDKSPFLSNNLAISNTSKIRSKTL